MASRRNFSVTNQVGHERRPQNLEYDGKSWTELSHGRRFYMPRPKAGDGIKLWNLPCELLLHVVSFLDSDSFCNFGKTSRQFESFLHDYRSMSRFLVNHIDMDLYSQRFEMVVFIIVCKKNVTPPSYLHHRQPVSPIQPERGKRCRDPIQASLPLLLRLAIIKDLETGFAHYNKHRHGIRCSYRASQQAMYLALKARHYKFVKYLVGVGKNIDGLHLLEILRKEGSAELIKFLSAVQPDKKEFSLLETALRGRMLSKSGNMVQWC